MDSLDEGDEEGDGEGHEEENEEEDEEEEGEEGEAIEVDSQATYHIISWNEVDVDSASITEDATDQLNLALSEDGDTNDSSIHSPSSASHATALRYSDSNSESSADGDHNMRVDRQISLFINDNLIIPESDFEGRDANNNQPPSSSVIRSSPTTPEENPVAFSSIAGQREDESAPADDERSSQDTHYTDDEPSRCGNCGKWGLPDHVCPIVCLHCGNPNHHHADCAINHITCVNCGDAGHFFSACPWPCRNCGSHYHQVPYCQ
jgi:hypothetical protein